MIIIIYKKIIINKIKKIELIYKIINKIKKIKINN
jgi:hypothetical protein